METEFTQCYAFTLTVNPKLYIRTLVHQLNCTARSLIGLFPHSKISEVIELTENFNAHYHGIIQFHYGDIKEKSPESYWYNKLRGHPTLGHSKIKVMTDEEGWKKYITKDIPRTEKELNKTYYTPIVIDEHNLDEFIRHMEHDSEAE